MKKLLLIAFFLPVVSLFSCNSSNQSSIDEEDSNSINYPNITERGVEPFCIGVSLFDIPSNGTFYDTIKMEKKIDVWEYDMNYTDIDTEEKLSEFLEGNDNLDFVTIEIDMFGYVIKGGDTILILKADKDAVIECLLVQSDKLSMDNGVRLGLTTKEMTSRYNAKLEMVPISDYGKILAYSLPQQPDNISILSNHTFLYGDVGKWEGISENEKFIFDSVADWKVGGIFVLGDKKTAWKLLNNYTNKIP